MDVQNTKQKALDDFTARLLQSPMKDHIARIVLFGSVLRERSRSHREESPGHR
jgi:predicted nucleotidyltransferase